VGDALDLQLLLQTDAAINTMPLAISFDPKVLQISRISEGDFFKKGGGQSSFSSRIDPSGQIVITANRLSSAPLTPELSGLLLTLNFGHCPPPPKHRFKCWQLHPLR
jgi:general secretion pathway protein D